MLALQRAQSAKRSGRKTDIKDSEWICRLAPARRRQLELCNAS
jgi:hypothetical protein